MEQVGREEGAPGIFVCFHLNLKVKIWCLTRQYSTFWLAGELFWCGLKLSTAIHWITVTFSADTRSLPTWLTEPFIFPSVLPMYCLETFNLLKKCRCLCQLLKKKERKILAQLLSISGSNISESNWIYRVIIVNIYLFYISVLSLKCLIDRSDQ